MTTSLPYQSGGTGNNCVERDNRPASLGKEMACKPWRSPLWELTGTAGIVFDRPLDYKAEPGCPQSKILLLVFPQDCL